MSNDKLREALVIANALQNAITEELAASKPEPQAQAGEQANGRETAKFFLPPALHDGIAENTVGTYRLRVTGLTIRQIKDIFEDKFLGSMMWSNGAAYPTDGVEIRFVKDQPDTTPPAQPAREWVGLTDEEIETIRQGVVSDFIAAVADKRRGTMSVQTMARAIESLCREKNAGLPAADDKAGGGPAGFVKQYELDNLANPVNPTVQATISKERAGFCTVPIYTRPQPQAEVRVPDGYVLVKLGFGKVEVASGNHEGVPALIFGKNGTGIIGEATQPDRVHAEGETLACVTFANAESLEVVQHHINEVRAMLSAAPKPQESGQ